MRNLNLTPSGNRAEFLQILLCVEIGLVFNTVNFSEFLIGEVLRNRLQLQKNIEGFSAESAIFAPATENSSFVRY